MRRGLSGMAFVLAFPSIYILLFLLAFAFCSGALSLCALIWSLQEEQEGEAAMVEKCEESEARATKLKIEVRV